MSDDDVQEIAGVRRLLFLVGSFMAGTVMIGSLCLGGAYLYVERPWSHPERDPRAYKGNNMALKEALKQTGAILPKEASNVHFLADGKWMGTSLYLSYEISCDAVPAVFGESGLTIPIAVDGLDNRVLRSAEKHGWRPENGPSTAFMDTMHTPTVGMVQNLPTGTCAVYITAYND